MSAIWTNVLELLSSLAVCTLGTIPSQSGQSRSLCKSRLLELYAIPGTRPRSTTGRPSEDPQDFPAVAAAKFPNRQHPIKQCGANHVLASVFVDIRHDIDRSIQFWPFKSV